MENREKMNIYTKLQAARVQLQRMNLKKTGQNKHKNFGYYELCDILPHINVILEALDMTSLVSFSPDIATLTLVDNERPEDRIVFTSPMREGNVQGTTPIQDLGAVETYQRRYLYLVAFEIVEADALDPTVGEPNPAQNAAASGRPRNGGAPAVDVASVAAQEPCCIDCGKPFKSGQLNGTYLTATQIMAAAVKKHGAALCSVCHQKRQQATA